MSNVNAKVYGLLGKNISYSLSPVMHNAALAHFGIPTEYKLFDRDFDTRAKHIDKDFLSLIKDNNIGGINVTVPYKIAVFDMLKSGQKCTIDSEAELLGAVNTVRSDGEKVKGYNTDVEGFYQSLQEDAGFDPKGKKVFLFGSGGAGRALCMYLASIGEAAPEEIFLYDSQEDLLCQLATVCKKQFGPDACVPVEAKDISGRMA